MTAKTFTTAVVALLLCTRPAAAQTIADSRKVSTALDRTRIVERWSSAIPESLIAPQWLSRNDRPVF